MSSVFHQLAIVEVLKETEHAITVRFAVPSDLSDQFEFEPGQHLTLRAMIDGDDVRRNYSICSAPQDNELRIAIKRMNGGKFSNWANDNLVAGISVEALAPAGAFTCAFDSARKAHYAMFASGSGITPIMSLLRSGLEGEQSSKFSLFYGNRDVSSILFLEELAQLKNRYMDRLAVHHFLSREDDEFVLLNGRIDMQKAAAIIEHFLPIDAIDAAFICGPEAMMEAVETVLKSAGLDQKLIKTERFGAGELTAERRAIVERLEEAAAGKPIRITVNGKTRTVRYDPKLETILENSRAAGLPAPFACKAGVCATCRARVIKGEVEMIRQFALSQDEIERGYILTCQAIPISDNVEIDFDA